MKVKMRVRGKNGNVQEIRVISHTYDAAQIVVLGVDPKDDRKWSVTRHVKFDWRQGSYVWVKKQLVKPDEDDPSTWKWVVIDSEPYEPKQLGLTPKKVA